MKKGQFCKCLEAMRKYGDWERKLYACEIDLAPTPITGVLDVLARCMCDFDSEWAYDEKLGLDWIIEWTFTPDSPNFVQTRHGRTWHLEDAGILYDFLEFMNEYGWEDE